MRRVSFDDPVRAAAAQQNAFVQHEYEEPSRPARLAKRDRRVGPQGDLTVCGVTVREHRNYPGKYMVEDVRRTGLPMWQKVVVGVDGSAARRRMYRERATRKLVERYHGQSRTERMRIGYPVEMWEKPIGWLMVCNGYVPLYEERERRIKHGA